MCQADLPRLQDYQIKHCISSPRINLVMLSVHTMQDILEGLKVCIHIHDIIESLGEMECHSGVSGEELE